MSALFHPYLCRPCNGRHGDYHIMNTLSKLAVSGASALLLLAQPAFAVNATPTRNPIFVDGSRVELQSYTIDGYTYYKIRDLAEVLDFTVDYDNASESIQMWNTPQNSVTIPEDPESTISDSSEHSAPEDSSKEIKRDCIDGKLVILLDAGHGGSDGGTHSVDERYFERDFNIAVAEKVKALLEAQGVQVLMLRGRRKPSGYWNPNASPGLTALCGNILSICCSVFTTMQPKPTT